MWSMFGEIRNKQGERLDYAFHSGGNEGGKCIVVLGHGVTGNKDRPFVVALAEAFAAAGIPALRVSFSGNGAVSASPSATCNYATQGGQKPNPYSCSSSEVGVATSLTISRYSLSAHVNESATSIAIAGTARWPVNLA